MYENYIVTPNGELYHYGVKGMKWGVRRDARILANHRRNEQVKRAAEDRKSGKISAEQYKEMKRVANAKKKKWLANVESAYTRSGSDKERAALDKSITEATLREVPKASVKRGAASVNRVFGIYNSVTLGTTAFALAAANPAFAGAAVGAAVVGVAAEKGYRYVVQLGLDKMS